MGRAIGWDVEDVADVEAIEGFELGLEMPNGHPTILLLLLPLFASVSLFTPVRRLHFGPYPDLRLCTNELARLNHWLNPAPIALHCSLLALDPSPAFTPVPSPPSLRIPLPCPKSPTLSSTTQQPVYQVHPFISTGYLHWSFRLTPHTQHQYSPPR